jgi:hypothetical protein
MSIALGVFEGIALANELLDFVDRLMDKAGVTPEQKREVFAKRAEETKLMDPDKIQIPE